MEQLGEYVHWGGARRPWGEFGGRGRGWGRAAGGRENVFRREDNPERPKEEEKNEGPQMVSKHSFGKKK